MPDWLLKLFESGAVWSALIAVMNILIKQYLPGMSVELLASINVLVLAVLAALGINVSSRIKSYRAARQ